MSTPDELPTIDQQRMLKELNDSGYPFQHTIAEAINRAGAAWALVNTEFPVSARNRTTHIDVLAWCLRRALIVGECKRVNPAYSDWLFAKLPGDRRDIGRYVRVERLFESKDGNLLTDAMQLESWSPHHVALEVKTNLPGDSKGQARSLRDAITQTQAGANALLAMLAQNQVLWKDERRTSVIVIPVIITTARLYTTDANLANADLATGRIPDGATVTRQDWLWLEDNVSPDLVHEVPSLVSAADIASIVRDRHARSIAVVHSAAIDGFLSSFAKVLFHYY